MKIRDVRGLTATIVAAARLCLALIVVAVGSTLTLAPWARATQTPATDLCADPAAKATVLLIFRYRAAVQDSDTSTVEALVTFDLSTNPSDFALDDLTVENQQITVPCSLSASLIHSAQDDSVRPTEPQTGVVREGEDFHAHWLVSGTSYRLAVGGVVAAASIQITYVRGISTVAVTTAAAVTTRPATTVLASSAPTSPETATTGTPRPSSAPTSSPRPTSRATPPPTTTSASPTALPDDSASGAGSPSEESSPEASVLPRVNSAATAAVAQCQQHVNEILNGRIVYEPKSQMQAGTTGPVTAVVTLDQTTPPESILPSASASVTAEPVQLPCNIEARLDGLVTDFEISPTTFEKREVAVGRNARWIWNVKPLHAGNSALTLIVRGILGDGSTTNETPITKTISVTATAGVAETTGFPVALVLVGFGVAGVAAGAWWLRRSRRLAPVAPLPMMATTPAGTSLFVSYSRKNSDRAAIIVKQLEAQGFEVWRDTDDIRGGEMWRRSIVKGIRASRLVIMLISPESLASPNVAREISIAQDQRTAILPVIIVPATMTDDFAYMLAGVQIVDVSALSVSESHHALLTAVEAIMQPSASVPPPPTAATSPVWGPPTPT